MIKLSLVKKFGIELVVGDVFEGVCIHQKLAHTLNNHDYEALCIESFTPRLISNGIPTSIDGDVVLELTNGKGLVSFLSARNAAWHVWSTWRPSMEWLVQQAADKPVTYKDDTQHFGEDVQVSADPKVELIHKAWVHLNGSLQNLTNPIEDGNHKQLVLCTKAYERFSVGCYTNAIFTNDIGDNYWKVICTVKEFNDYCEKMTEALKEDSGVLVNSSLKSTFNCCYIGDSKPTFTQAMADAGELPPVGSECLVMPEGYKAVITYIGNGAGCFICLDDGTEYGFRNIDTSFKLLDTRTEKQKAVDQVITDIGMDDELLTYPSTVIAKMIGAGLLK